MPIEVGSIKSITFAVDKQTDEQLGKDVRLRVAKYSDDCPKIKQVVVAVPKVTVLIKTYGGSGAVTKYGSKTIVVSRSLAGGVSEIAESALFELLNWHQGDFSSREHERVKNGEITPKQAGVNIAKCESKTIHGHGEFMQALKNKGHTLSAQGERNRAATSGQSLAQVENATMISAHDSDADNTDPTSLFTPEMYWYQMIEAIQDDEFHGPVTLRGINDPSDWLPNCIGLVWKYNIMAGESQASLFVKLINLAKLYGCTLKGGYEFTAAMKTVAKETTPVSRRFQMSTKTIPGEAGMPGDLKQRFTAVGLLS